MSSTNGQSKFPNEYYITPISEIVKFLEAWREDVHPLSWPQRILDPCAGGNKETITVPRLDKLGNPHKDGPWIVPPSPPSYPEAFRQIPDWNPTVVTADIRTDAIADYAGCFLEPTCFNFLPKFDAIIFNPPFSLALEFIQKALNDVRPSGFVAALLRLNFLGSNERNAWLRANPPTWIYVHGKRMSFTPDGGTDSIEYAHMVWSRPPHREEKYSKLRVLAY